MTAPVPTAKRPSFYLLVIILITLLLFLVLIITGIDYMEIGLDTHSRTLFMLLVLTILALSAYMLFQARRRMLKLSLETQPLITTLLCQKCGFKNLREFTCGDYVFKHVEEQCPKCSEKTFIISSIYREYKEKEKAREES